ncbi:PREDICTED: probable 39S ribosomal protein L49, mitochondrial [Nicrophorus vespilloides]|uniref:Large ribosomal subunit protein mL49 n=1 Tax=Nicrophorus vespilloides TaxID=110193 RepID=A0ABM1MM25_NICVS|nr:PREDICTED: probable 39S ribosomal protein L49, mitochondrial [Nicrophorus vespilloides]
MASLASKFRFLLKPKVIPTIEAISCRYSSFRSSPFIHDVDDSKVKYETSKDPVEWSFVERILPPKVVPNIIKKDEYLSEWRPQSEEVVNQPYFIQRNKNHMMPVYMKTSYRGMRRLTYLKKVQGDIWMLEKDLKEFLQKEQLKPIQAQVNEFVGYICFHGDYVNAIKYWLGQKGF